MVSTYEAMRYMDRLIEELLESKKTAKNNPLPPDSYFGPVEPFGKPPREEQGEYEIEEWLDRRDRQRECNRYSRKWRTL